jgi:hypothetical protein
MFAANPAKLLGLWIERSGSCALLMLAMEVALRDDRGLLKQATGRDVESQSDVLGVRPGQRCGRGGAGA